MDNKLCTCTQMLVGLYDENISFEISRDPVSPNCVITYRSITYLLPSLPVALRPNAGHGLLILEVS